MFVAEVVRANQGLERTRLARAAIVSRRRDRGGARSRTCLLDRSSTARSGHTSLPLPRDECLERGMRAWESLVTLVGGRESRAMGTVARPSTNVSRPPRVLQKVPVSETYSSKRMVRWLGLDRSSCFGNHRVRARLADAGRPARDLDRSRRVGTYSSETYDRPHGGLGGQTPFERLLERANRKVSRKSPLPTCARRKRIGLDTYYR